MTPAARQPTPEVTITEPEVAVREPEVAVKEPEVAVKELEIYPTPQAEAKMKIPALLAAFLHPGLAPYVESELSSPSQPNELVRAIAGRLPAHQSDEFIVGRGGGPTHWILDHGH